MDSQHSFDPFNDRLSRDIRNNLSSSLVDCLESGTISFANEVAREFLENKPAPHYVQYIEERLKRYEKAVEAISTGSEDPFWRSLVLWDLELFFEMHEVLEHAWYEARGDTKLIMQALIRAAGMYIKLEYGFTEQARKMALKSHEVLEKHKPFLATYFEPDILLLALQDTIATPPKLLSQNYTRKTAA